jgi:hypothetical protein
MASKVAFVPQPAPPVTPGTVCVLLVVGVHVQSNEKLENAPEHVPLPLCVELLPFVK